MSDDIEKKPAGPMIYAVQKGANTVADLFVLPTLAVEVDSQVKAMFEQIREYVEAGGVSGIAIGMTFRDGRSWTKATKTEDRRIMLALLLDCLLDFQKNT
jgi:hypothetical protein